MQYQLPRMYAGGVFIILLGVFINKVILHIEKTSFFWRETVEIFDAASPVSPQRTRSKVFNRYFPAVVVILIAAIIAAGGREINRLNTERTFQPAPHANHDKHTTHGQHTMPPGSMEKKDDTLNYITGD